MTAHAKPYVAQSLVAFLTFAAFGTPTVAALLRADASESWRIAVFTAGFSAGVSGACCWAVAYSKEWRPSVLRSIFAGGLTGILCHFFYCVTAVVGSAFGLIEGVTLERVSFGELEEALFAAFTLPMLYGVVTVPAGIFAALATRQAVTGLGARTSKSARESSAMRSFLRFLLVVVPFVSFVLWVGYMGSRPFYAEATTDCGDGRTVTLLRPNELCDRAGPVHFTFDGIQSPEPPSFMLLECGEVPHLRARITDDGSIAMLVGAETQSTVFIIADFTTGWSWPTASNRQTGPTVEEMVSRLEREFGEFEVLLYEGW
ncbi:MAG: hypothetical protein CMJ48_05830 [Planctomycetaceae bacterium]|nr:hypothetical protein [Planctomycetaceae bacterium]